MSEPISQQIAYYLAKGFDEQTAAYFAHGRQKLTAAMANDNFTLTLEFSNGERRLFDMKPLLEKGGVFSPLRQWHCFRRVYVDENGCPAWDIDPSVDSRLVWNNRVDISPDTCYLKGTPL